MSHDGFPAIASLTMWVRRRCFLLARTPCNTPSAYTDSVQMHTYTCGATFAPIPMHSCAYECQCTVAFKRHSLWRRRELKANNIDFYLFFYLFIFLHNTLSQGFLRSCSPIRGHLISNGIMRETHHLLFCFILLSHLIHWVVEVRVLLMWYLKNKRMNVCRIYIKSL